MKRKLMAAACALTMAITVTSAYADTASTEQKHAPEVMNLEIETYRNTAVGGVLTAADPDGERVTFTLTTEPVKGTVELQEDGTFTYTPDENKRGKDYFGYKATDASGNDSQEATVIIRIRKQKTAVTYADMAGRPEAYDAVCLAEQGVFTGTCVSGQYLFEPEASVSRGEFLSMCLAARGEEMLQGVMSTGFGDDDAIPVWAKSSVSTARMNGMVFGYSDGKRVVFGAQRPITHAEAAVILDRMLQPEPVSYTLSDAVPAWAEQAVANLTASEIYPVDARSDQALTRAECATMLVKAMEQMG